MLELKFDGETGVGYFPCDEFISQGGLADPYDKNYFDKYHGYSETEMGRRINDYRLKLVNRFTSGLVVDIGIGSGQFVESRNALGFNTLGIDVNPRGIEWLQEKKWEATLDNPVPVLTFWDSLEHVKDFKPLLKKAQKFVFVCIPIFTDYKSVFVSKHFRKTEHFHYFNHMGFVSTFWNEGFRLIEYSDAEQELGREGVRTYVFKRA